MVILDCFQLSRDDYTLLCECETPGKPDSEFLLADRTALNSLRERRFVYKRKRLWLLTEKGEAVVDAVPLAAPYRPTAGPAKVLNIKRDKG